MQDNQFSTTVFGKWIMAGEHAVLRGSAALVFPLPTKTLTLTWNGLGSEGIRLELTGPNGKELELLFWGVLERACVLSGTPRELIKGVVVLDNAIPVGAGMGASAALSVSLAKWFCYMGRVPADGIYEFARNLENLFHGESSGVDIAVALSGAPLHFERAGKREKLKVNWQPLCFVSYSGKRGVTLECVAKVKSLLSADPQKGLGLDQKMAQAVQLCESALESTGDIEKLKLAFDMALNCFEEWGLARGSQEHMEHLRRNGALAVKPTGSGDGGFVLSLWQNPPPENLIGSLTPCF